jgi:hypothetical protein
LLDGLGAGPTGQDDGGASLWWQGERLHRAVLPDYPARSAVFLADLAQLQGEFVRRTAEIERHGRVDAGHTAALLREAREAVAGWAAKVGRAGSRRQLSFYRRSWQSQNSIAHFAP